ncbi:branched-chain amino acid ABC transporter permease [Tepidimonas charontis]|uniref:High-affinity branched-chain amino acid transport system permease protein LivH n=1 Tax=Tepidimonas charontis TaxID=2267262 RepID=A0A554XIN0_9BURK|nr:branched-chain amino acid ABC transporter permease [Tepidimonas charontis]TSE35648.1 High-affinity branched-chain amino acid transport system permease protein LivH [Tepidimonas charontis]
MDGQIALFLAQDGLINGAIYALMALALVLVFSVTRVIFVPQGELVAYGALTMAVLQAGGVPATLWLLLALAAATLALEGWRQLRGGLVDWWSTALWCVAAPALAALAVWWQPQDLLAQALVVVLVVTPLGPLIYRLAFRPLSHATVLVLLIVSVALHGVLMGLGLWFFGAEGARTPPFSEARFDWGGLRVSGQSLVVLAATGVLVLAMFAFFERTVLGKALRATAINRVGARLMGIPTELSGDVSFALAAFIGAVGGLLIAPITTIYYDTGFLVGLKGFVAAIIGGLASYPAALLGALLVGQLEAFASFWASAFKEVLVFTLIIPVLLWRSLRSHHVEEEE